MKLNTEVKEQGKQLYVAAYHVKLDEVQSYLVEGVDPNEVLTEKIDDCASSSVGETPLYGVVSGIMEHGFTDNTGKTADALIKAGADVNYKNKGQDGNTILQIAVDLNAKEMVMLLIGHGADPKLNNDNGIGAYTQARLGNNQDLIELMEACRNRYNIKEAIKQLKKFPEREGISAILKILSELESSLGVEDETIESLRHQLHAILIDKNSDDVTKGDLSLSDASYNALLALAEFSPINTKDPITLDKIDKDSQVVVSTGHQFDIKALAKWIKTKKEFVNPLTNKVFTPRDQITIQCMCVDNGINLIEEQAIAPQPVAQYAVARGLFQRAPSFHHLTHAQRTAVNLLLQHGLTENHLRSWTWGMGGEFFGHHHTEALRYLITEKGLAGDQAVNEINKLSSVQTCALQFLYDGGLRGDHLRTWTWEIGDESFGQDHTEALCYLITEKELAGDQAVNEINKLSSVQTRALQSLYDGGLRGDHLRTWIWEIGGEFFGRNHTEALRYLITEKELAGDQAVNEINKLSSVQTRALQSLYDSGLRGDHLRAWEMGGESFGGNHREALRYLIIEKELAVDQAVNEINGFTSAQAKRVSEGETRAQILGNGLSL